MINCPLDELESLLRSGKPADMDEQYQWYLRLYALIGDRPCLDEAVKEWRNRLDRSEGTTIAVYIDGEYVGEAGRIPGGKWELHAADNDHWGEFDTADAAVNVLEEVAEHYEKLEDEPE